MTTNAIKKTAKIVYKPGWMTILVNQLNFKIDRLEKLAQVQA